MLVWIYPLLPIRPKLIYRKKKKSRDFSLERWNNINLAKGCLYKELNKKQFALCHFYSWFWELFRTNSSTVVATVQYGCWLKYLFYFILFFVLYHDSVIRKFACWKSLGCLNVRTLHLSSYLCLVCPYLCSQIIKS